MTETISRQGLNCISKDNEKSYPLFLAWIIVENFIFKVKKRQCMGQSFPNLDPGGNYFIVQSSVKVCAPELIAYGGAHILFASPIALRTQQEHFYWTSSGYMTFSFVQYPTRINDSEPTSRTLPEMQNLPCTGHFSIGRASAVAVATVPPAPPVRCSASSRGRAL